MPTWNPKSYVPQTPSWLAQSNETDLRNFQKQIPGLFDTSGMEGAYTGAISNMLSGQRASANAAANAYTTRQLNAGGSPVGSGFAVGSAMLNAYRQQQAMMLDLEKNKLAARSAQAGALGQTAEAIARSRAARQGMLSDWNMGQQKLYQGQSQFDADQSLRKYLQSQQLAQQNSQFNKSYSLDQQQFGLKKDLAYSDLDMRREMQNRQLWGNGPSGGMNMYGVGNTWFSRPKSSGW